MIRLEQAVERDIEGIAHVHIESWKTTYRGLIADEFLDPITQERRVKLWLDIFASLQDDDRIVVGKDGDCVVAFAHGGKCREAELGYEGELYSIYILKEYQGMGLGQQLLNHIINHLRSKGNTSMMAWVLEGNPSIDFYLRMGGKPFSSKEIQIGNEVKREIAIGWSLVE
ncbi:GNAT family N-acetyltransferase [Paenibacillus phoenicis]|uniref:GNAT family N-acetyltransferase n=1 Tax=Paenibacillus phoenicis TaxID=554117 RepID=A0ABU5PH06_9BACL|nr:MULTISPECIES: GNAT family N-acetyltransferase [Paenibacillus]EES74965.1 acetyltransferase, GNAT family [Paenibacillus sp. oral taxon 786 str. D14]MEA3569181.1 GNAT family N-acetyltransferase [Paenibacillus phoenicis]